MDLRDFIIKKHILVIYFLCFITFAYSEYGFAEQTTDSTNTKIIVIELDSLSKDTLYDSLDELPNISEIIRGKDKSAHFVYVPSVETIIPSASIPANVSMYTGVYPDQHGIFSTSWLDRTKVKVYNRLTYPQNRINSMLAERGVKTIFDYAREGGRSTFVSMLFIGKGVEPENWIRSNALMWCNGFWLNIFTDFIPVPEPAHADKRGTRGFLKGHIYSLSDGIEGFYAKHNTLPDLMVIHYSGFDIFSHYPHRFQYREKWPMKDIQRYYLKEIIDPQIGRIVAWLKKIDKYNECIFFFIADHGMTKIEKHIDDSLADDALSASFKTNSSWRRFKNVEALCMAGAGTKAIYIKNRREGSWHVPPSLARDIKPAIDLLIKNDELLSSTAAILIRQFPGDRSEGVSETALFWSFDISGYMQTRRSERDFLNALNPLSSIDVLNSDVHLSLQLERQYAKDSAPDIVLITKQGLFFAPDKGKYGHHGSIYSSDNLVSYMMGGPSLSRRLVESCIIQEKASVLDFVPTVMGLLHVAVPSNLAGKDIISTYCTGFFRETINNK